MQIIEGETELIQVQFYIGNTVPVGGASFLIWFFSIRLEGQNNLLWFF